MDKMGNGGVSFPEYLEYMSVTANGTEEQKSEQTFRFMTQNKTDKVSYEDFEAMIIAVAQTHGTLMGSHFSATSDYKSETKRLFKELDLKKDGYLDLDEYKERRSDFK